MQKTDVRSKQEIEQALRCDAVTGSTGIFAAAARSDAELVAATRSAVSQIAGIAGVHNRIGEPPLSIASKDERVDPGAGLGRDLG